MAESVESHQNVLEKRSAPTKLQLENLEDTARNLLQNKLKETDAIESDDPEVIRHEIKCVKNLSDAFHDASKNLSKWYRNNGHVNMLNCIRKQRIALCHEESPDYVKDLNAKLSQLGEETSSSLEIWSNTTAASQIDHRHF